MKLPLSKLKAAGLALAGIVLTTLPATAALVPNPQSGDLFIAFRASGGQGAESSYLINIGSDLTYRNAAAGSSFDLSLGNIAVDLIAAFGADWSTRDDLYWGVFGTRAAASSVLYGSKARADINTPSAAWASISWNREIPQARKSAAFWRISGDTKAGKQRPIVRSQPFSRISPVPRATTNRSRLPARATLVRSASGRASKAASPMALMVQCLISSVLLETEYRMSVPSKSMEAEPYPSRHSAPFRNHQLMRLWLQEQDLWLLSDCAANRTPKA